MTDRCTKAVGQLDDGSSPVRIGGVYALERIGNDSANVRLVDVTLGVIVRATPERITTGHIENL